MLNGIFKDELFVNFSDFLGRVGGRFVGFVLGYLLVEGYLYVETVFLIY